MKLEILNKAVVVLIVIILGFLIVEGINIYIDMKRDPELVGKPPYSFLQWAEQKNSIGDKNINIIFEKGEKFCAVGIREKSEEDNKKVWLLLNYSDDLNGVYILGNEKYSLTHQDYNEMEKFCKIDPRVSVELKKHLR